MNYDPNQDAPTGQSQPPTYQGPYTAYGAPPPPRKKRRTGLIILIIIGVLVLCGVAGIIGAAFSPSTAAGVSVATATAQDATTPTDAATTAPQTWHTVQTIKGNGIKKTGVFSVPGDWKIVWTCDHSSFQGLDYNVIITVYNSDGTPADVAINDLCKKGSTSGETEEHTAGSVYLDINSEGSYVIKIQTLS